ncbi:MAG: transglutaminase family protein, partial [Chloroflexota bacterium]|nr:transglutaminase family protein [Chloroflexota bacterium]
MQVKIGCTFVYDSPWPTPMVFVVQARTHDRHRLLDEFYQVTPTVPVESYADHFGNRTWRLVAPIGLLQLHYDAMAAVDSTPDPVLSYLPQTPVEQLPADVLPFTLPSRY